MVLPERNCSDRNAAENAGGCPSTCPGARPRSLHSAALAHPLLAAPPPSALGNWPIQLRLAPIEAPYYAGATLLLAADCVPFALAGFHATLLAGRVLLAGCPKLDGAPVCAAKLVGILRSNAVQALEVAFMEVPCCQGLARLAEEAIQASGKPLPLARKEVTLQGGLR